MYCILILLVSALTSKGSVVCVSDEFDSYIIVSFVNATLVLSIGETVEEVTDSGFLGTTPTLSCHALGDDALVQVKILRLQLSDFEPDNLTIKNFPSLCFY